MAPLILVRREEASILVEVPVDLLDFGHLPTRHGSRAKTAIRGRSASLTGLELSLASRRYLVRDIINFILEGFSLLLSKIAHLIAVELLPSLGLSGRQDWRLRKNVTITRGRRRAPEQV